VRIFSYHLRGKFKLLWAIAAARDPQSERLHPVAEPGRGAARIDIQPDAVLDLGRERGIGRGFEGADLMRPQAVLDPLTLSPLTVAIAGRWS
jgi:hypothetical protein